MSEHRISEHMLHILAPSRFDSVGAIVGDYVALYALREAINDAIHSGTGGTFLMQSDGEGYSLAVVQTPDMSPVCTTYAGEVSPARSKREKVSMRALPRFLEAIHKSYKSGWVEENGGSSRPESEPKIVEHWCFGSIPGGSVPIDQGSCAARQETQEVFALPFEVADASKVRK